MNITSGKVEAPQKVVVYGPEGIGKTTLAAAFPNPLFIDTEGGTNHFDVRRADPSPTSWSMLVGYVGEVAAAGPGLCSTLVVDTADWAERLCVEHVCAKNGWQSIEGPGYGKGYKCVNEEFGRLLDRLSDCVQAGVNVVVCAHARISKFEQPDELGTYDRWTMKLIDTPKASNAAMLKEWADMVLLCNYETIIVKPDKSDGGHAKAAGGKRVMYAEHTPAWDAKNRHGLPAKMPLDYAAIAACVPEFGVAGYRREEPAPAEPKAQPAPVIAKDLKFEEVDDAPAPAPGPAKSDEPAHLRPLRDLMAGSNVTDGMLQAYCAEKGYCTADTPVSVYPEDFAAYLVSAWAEIHEAIGVPFK